MAAPSTATRRLARSLIEHSSQRSTGIVVTPALRIELRDGFVVGLFHPDDGEAVEGPWVEALVATLAALADANTYDFVLERVVHDGGHTTRVDPVSLLLDALAAHASPAHVAAIASNDDEALEWRDGPRLRTATDWSKLPAASRTLSIATLTARNPNAARRASALLDAGFAVLVPRAEKSSVSLFPSLDDDAHSSRSPLRPGYARLALPKDLVREETPNGALLELDDPLLPVFRVIENGERDGVSSEVFSAAWIEAARLWRTRYGAVGEAVRALREAAAKSPADAALLLDAAYACAGIGDLDAAIGYAKSAASAAVGGRSREKAATQLAHLALRIGERRMAIAALRSATRDEPVRAETFARLAVLVADTDDEEAAELTAEACLRDEETGNPFRYDPAIIARALRDAIETEDPDKIEDAGARALLEALTSPELEDVLWGTVDALDAFDGAERALAFAIRVADRFGARRHDARERLMKLAERATHAPLRAAAFERAIGSASPEVARVILVKLAELHRNIGDGAAESRAWLRLLANVPSDEVAFTNLLRIYVECGKHDELRTLAKVAERDFEEAPSEASLLRFLRATSTYETAEETFERAMRCCEGLPARERRLVVEHACALVERAFGDPADRASRLARAVEKAPASAAALVAFERACLLAKDAKLAEAVFENLILTAAGPNTRRAVLYRFARLLENLGAFRLALEAFAASFREVPSAGVTLHSLERLGILIGDVRPAVDALRTLARTFRAPALQAEWTRRADALEAPLAPASTPPARSTPPKSAPPTAFSEETLQDALTSLDPDRALSLARSLLGHPTRWHEAGVLLRAAIRWAPFRVDVLKALSMFAERQASRFEQSVCESLLACFDDRPITAPIAPPVLFDALLLSATEDDFSPEAKGALRMVWEHAAPLFKKPLSDYGARPIDRLPPLAQTPVSRAWRRVSLVLGDTQTQLYRHELGGGALTLARTMPPSIVVPEITESNELELAFRIARLLVLARAPYVLLTTSSSDEGAAILDALFAAFGATHEGERPSREALTIAGELWKAIPTRDQRELRDVLGAAGPIDHASYVRSALATSARVALLTIGDPGVALRGLAADDPNATSVSSENDKTDWGAFVALSPSAQALIRFAFSETYLTALALSER
jgi:tetratricopeptide (TPR) repeat protein